MLLAVCWAWIDIDESTATLAIIPQVCFEAAPSLKGSRRPEAVASITVVWALAILAVILRLFSRKIASVRYGMDDYLIVLGLVSNSVLAYDRSFVQVRMMNRVSDIFVWTCGWLHLRYASCRICFIGHSAPETDWSCVGGDSGFGEHMIRLNLAEITRFSKVCRSWLHGLQLGPLSRIPGHFCDSDFLRIGQFDHQTLDPELLSAHLSFPKNDDHRLYSRFLHHGLGNYILFPYRLQLQAH